MNKFNLTCSAAALSAALLATASPSAARAQPTYRIDLPAQNLASSLRTVGSLVGVSVAFQPETVKGRSAPAIHGQYAPADALAALVRDSGLALKSTSSGGYFVVADEEAPMVRRVSWSEPAPRVRAVVHPEPAAGGGGAQLEEIVVQARRVTENLQTTPVAVSALTSAQLQNQTLRDFREIQRSVPSFRAEQMSLSASSSVMSIRGLSSGDVAVNNDPAVGIYVDGVYLPHAVGSEAMGVVDLDHVEVLRGPQGTLYGRNTIGGAVALYSREPTQNYEGMAQATFGNFSLRDFSGVVNIPLNDTLALRVQGRQYDQNGTGKNLFNGAQLGGRHGNSFKVSLRWAPTDAVTVLARADYARISSDSSALKPYKMTLGSAANQEVARETGLSNAAARDLYLSYRGGSFYDATVNNQPSEDSEVWGSSLTVNWDVAPHLRLKSITAQRRFLLKAFQDLDASPFRIIEQRPLNEKDNQFSQEFQLLGDAFGDRLDYILGAYYSKETGFQLTRQIATAALSATNPALTGGDVENRSQSLFGHANFKLTSNLAISGGLRYTEDKRSLDSFNQNATTCLALGRPLAAGPCLFSETAKFHKLSYTASVEYNPSGELFLYAKVSNGYRSGGLPLGGGSPTSPILAAGSFVPFKPEEALAYEAGVKSQWFDNRLRANLAVYHTEYDDVQVSTPFTIPGTNLIVTAITNAAKGKINGAELDLEARPIDGLELRGSTAYTDAQFRNFTLAPFRFVPKWAYNLSAAYTHETEVGALRGQVNYDWASRLYTSAFIGRPSLGLLSARLSLHIDSLDADIALWGKNLTAEKYFAYTVDTGALGIQASYAGAPRTYGVELKKHF